MSDQENNAEVIHASEQYDDDYEESSRQQDATPQESAVQEEPVQIEQTALQEEPVAENFKESSGEDSSVINQKSSAPAFAAAESPANKSQKSEGNAQSSHNVLSNSQPGVPQTIDEDAEEQEEGMQHQIQQQSETPFKSGNLMQESGDLPDEDPHGAGSGYIGEFSSEYINAEIFKLFDVDGSGKIDRNDLHECAKAMGWSEQQLDDFILELDPNHDGEITEEEFMLVMKYIQQRTSTQFPPLGQSQSMSSAGASQQEPSQQMHLYESDKKKYGALLPKTGVYFLPDDKVIGFLRILNALRLKAEKDNSYTSAKIMKQKFDEFSRAEQQRQEQNMRLAQEKELMNIEQAQKAQFTEFQQAWDKYMADYEQTAFQLIEKLKAKQEQEMLENQERISIEFKAKIRGSKNLIDKKKQEKIYFAVKDYDRAEIMRLQIEQQEQLEYQIAEEKLMVVLDRESEKLRAKQALTLQSLLKRIQRDREEQVKHRQQDSQRLIQRNKNLLQDILEKQATEQRRTYSFLRYALGKREEKSAEQLKADMNMKSYQPRNDPMMPRLFRKYNPNMSQSLISNQSSIASKRQLTKYDNEGSQFNRERYTLVNHPLRTKQMPAQAMQRKGNNSVELDSFMKSNAQSGKKPDDVLIEMKELYKMRQGKDQYGQPRAKQSGNLPKI